MTALRVDCAWPLPGTLVVGGVPTAFGAWTPVAPGLVRVELHADVAGPGWRLTGTLGFDQEVAAGTSVRIAFKPEAEPAEALCVRGDPDGRDTMIRAVLTDAGPRGTAHGDNTVA